MPYDPRMLPRGGGGAPVFDPYAQQQPWWQQGPQQRQGVQFAAPPTPQQPKQWYEGLQIPKDPYGKPGQPADQSEDQTKKPTTLYEMMLNLGRMTPAEYNKAVKGEGAPGAGTPAAAARVSPWAFLGSMWGGGKS